MRSGFEISVSNSFDGTSVVITTDCYYPLSYEPLTFNIHLSSSANNVFFTQIDSFHYSARDIHVLIRDILSTELRLGTSDYFLNTDCYCSDLFHGISINDACI